MAKICINFIEDILLEKLRASAKKEKLSLSRKVEGILKRQIDNIDDDKEKKKYYNLLQLMLIESCLYLKTTTSPRSYLKNNVKRHYVNSNMSVANSRLLLNVIKNFENKHSPKLTVICTGRIEIETLPIDLRKKLLNLVIDNKDVYKHLNEIEDADMLWYEVFDYIRRLQHPHREKLISKMNISFNSKKEFKIYCAVLFITDEFLTKYPKFIEGKNIKGSKHTSNMFDITNIDFDSICYKEKGNTPQANDKYRYWIPLPFKSIDFPLEQGQFFIGILRTKTKRLDEYKSNQTIKAHNIITPVIIKNIITESEIEYRNICY